MIESTYIDIDYFMFGAKGICYTIEPTGNIVTPPTVLSLSVNFVPVITGQTNVLLHHLHLNQAMMNEPRHHIALRCYLFIQHQKRNKKHAHIVRHARLKIKAFIVVY